MNSLIPSSLLFIAASLLGTGIKNRYKKRYIIMKEFYELTVFTEREISVRRPIYEIMDKFQQSCDKSFVPVIAAMKSEMQKGGVSTESLGVNLNAVERSAFSDYMRLGSKPNGKDVEIIAQVKQAAQEFKNKAQDSVNKEGKMYFRLCVIAGIALMILVV